LVFNFMIIKSRKLTEARKQRTDKKYDSVWDINKVTLTITVNLSGN